MTSWQSDISDVLKRGFLAGAAGGLAEILWVSLYAVATGGDAATLAREVTTAAGVTALLLAAPVTMGIAVHMALAVLLGIAVAGLWQVLARKGAGMSGLYATTIAALVAVWTINFFIVLPVISPAFTHLVPYSVSLASKLLFGLAAAETLRQTGALEAKRARATIR